jgi:hypothetical protein
MENSTGRSVEKISLKAGFIQAAPAEARVLACMQDVGGFKGRLKTRLKAVKDQG